MKNVTEIPPVQNNLPMEERSLRVAAYCRVSTEQEEQDTSLQFQETYYRWKIEENPNWENAGIVSEKATALSIKGRPEFHTMMRRCRKGKIDLILTKSTSRFGRNTLDMLRSLQELQSLSVDVYFEKENLWLHERKMQIILTMYCAFAQAESEDMSRDIKWGIRQGFRSGTSGYAEFVCFGYKRGDDGRLAIDEPDAKIVRKIFQMKADGESLGTISAWLYENKILSPTGRERWSRESISKLLKNEKYVGDVMLQKTFVKDLLSGKQVKNKGELERYIIQEHHPAIISRELFEKINEVLYCG